MEIEYAEKPGRVQPLLEAAFTCFGAKIGLRSNDPSVIRDLALRLPPRARITASSGTDQVFSVWVDGPLAADAEHSVFRDKSVLLKRAARKDALDLLASSLHMSVAMHAQPLFVHAGVVGWQGRALVIPGLSRAGKSTLVAELVRQGAVYYSDEYAVLDEKGLVHSYPKPLSIRQTGAAPRQVSAKELGGRAGSHPIRVGLVVVTRYCAGAQWQPRTLSPAQSMIALMQNTVMARVRPESTMQTLGRAVSGVHGLESRRGDVGEVATRLLETADALFA